MTWGRPAGTSSQGMPQLGTAAHLQAETVQKVRYNARDTLATSLVPKRPSNFGEVSRV